MKRIVVVLIVVMLLLAACGVSESNPSRPPQDISDWGGRMVYLGAVGVDEIYRFTDGDVVCYYVSAGGRGRLLDCTE